MRGRIRAGAMGSGCAGLMVLALVTPAAGGSGPGRMGTGDVAADCEDASMNAPPSGTGDVKLTTDVVEGATVAPGDDILLRLSWDRTQWSGRQLDRVLDCVRVKGGLDPNLSAEEQPADNDGLFEYTLHVPDDIRPGCDVCAEGFVAGEGAGGGLLLERSRRHCFMSGPPAPPATRPPTPPAPPVIESPATPPTTAAPRLPAELPNEVAAVTASQPPAAPAPVAPAPAAELPRTGTAASRAGTAGGGLALAVGGLATIGGAGRRRRRRTED